LEFIDREKCYHYWPSCNLPKLYGEVEVEILSERLENFNLMHKWIISELSIRYKVLFNIRHQNVGPNIILYDNLLGSRKTCASLSVPDLAGF
jgi:hypothetical protein